MARPAEVQKRYPRYCNGQTTQSVGAAVFGAIFNATLGARLRAVPAPLRAYLPRSVSGVSATIGRASRLGPAAGYLRAAISAATHNVYIGLVISAVVTLLVVLAIIPRHVAPAAPDQPVSEPGP